MAVTFVMGAPRSGKSYYTVKKYILDNLKDGRKVIGNIQINMEYLAELVGKENALLYEYRNPFDYPKKIKYKKMISGEEVVLEVESKMPFDHEGEFIRDEWRSPNGGQAPVYVVDECQEIFARTLYPSEELLRFLSKHGHFAEMDIILISQGIGPMHERVKMCVEILVRFTKLGFMGNPNKYLRREYAGSTYTGVTPFVKKRETYDQSIFALYKSHTETKGELKNIKRHKGSPFHVYFFRGALLLVIVAVVFVIFSSKSITHGGLVGDVKSSESKNNVEHSDLNPTVQSSSPVPASTPLQSSNQAFVGPMPEPKKAYSFDNINRQPELRKREMVKRHGDVKRAPFFNHHFGIAAYLKSDKKELMHFNIDFNATGMRTNQSSEDLARMGYKVIIYNDCLALLDHKYEENAFYVYCERKDITKNNQIRTKA